MNALPTKILLAMDGSEDAAFAARVAEEGDEAETLLAMGSRGLGAIRRLRPGSVSTEVLRAASGPVLIFPHAVREGRKTAAAVHPSWNYS
jgi:hypothetical protein